MAHTKSKGSTTLGRDSISKRLGVKLFGGEAAKVGAIIVRQKGTKYRPGKNVKKGKDDTLFAIKAGKVEFKKKKIKLFNGQLKQKTFVNVVPQK